MLPSMVVGKVAVCLMVAGRGAEMLLTMLSLESDPICVRPRWGCGCEPEDETECAVI